jgi:selenocysteine-specific elongation factor
LINGSPSPILHLGQKVFAGTMRGHGHASVPPFAPMPTLPFILATAGHVDHGKSSLIKALTGTDPDRLPEEKARGITIDLGFAELQLASPPHVSPAVTYRVGIVDVPGHEDFVKNMVAGIGSIDLALLVVAADDGWMPQTEEHLQILTYLGVIRGVVALTKIDLIASEQEAVGTVRAKLQGSPFADAAIVPTSVVSGRGLVELKAALAKVLSHTPVQRDIGKPRLPVDRAFTLKGIGTVVTGTLAGGTLRRGQAVVLQPSGRPTRVRNVQTHGRDVETGLPGSRVALNLPDLSVDAGKSAESEASVGRGDVVAVAEPGSASDTLDVLLERSPRRIGGGEGPVLRDGAVVHVHHGSGDFTAKVHLLDGKELPLGGRTLAQLRFESSVYAFAGDRVVLRDWPARHTLAGGVVLDPEAQRRGFHTDARRGFLEPRAAAPNDPLPFVATQLERDGAAIVKSLLTKSRFSQEEIAHAASDLAKTGKAVLAGEVLIDAARWAVLRNKAVGAIDAEHKARPQESGLKLVELRKAIESDLPAADVFDALVADLCRAEFVKAGATIRRTSHRPALPPNLASAGARVRQALAAKPCEPPSRKELTRDPQAMQALRFLLTTGEAVEIADDLVMLADPLRAATETIRKDIAENGPATVSDLRQLLGTNRRVIVPLMEYLDRTGVTVRKGDVRELRQPIPPKS